LIGKDGKAVPDLYGEMPRKKQENVESDIDEQPILEVLFLQNAPF